MHCAGYNMKLLTPTIKLVSITSSISEFLKQRFPACITISIQRFFFFLYLFLSFSLFFGYKNEWMNVMNAPLTLLFVIFGFEHLLLSFLCILYIVHHTKALETIIYGNNMAFSPFFSLETFIFFRFDSVGRFFLVNGRVEIHSFIEKNPKKVLF